MSYVSVLTCGDDGNALPKPHPNNVQHICETLSLKPKDAVVVGDTEADMLMGLQAGELKRGTNSVRSTYLSRERVKI